MEQSEWVHPGCSLPASEKGGMQVRKNALKRCPRLMPWSGHAAGPRWGRTELLLVQVDFPSPVRRGCHSRQRNQGTACLGPSPALPLSFVSGTGPGQQTLLRV